jgi:hypothetical protein
MSRRTRSNNHLQNAIKINPHTRHSEQRYESPLTTFECIFDVPFGTGAIWMSECLDLESTNEVDIAAADKKEVDLRTVFAV